MPTVERTEDGYRLRLTLRDCYAGMVVAWEKGDRKHAGMLARVLVETKDPRVSRVWLLNALAILTYLPRDPQDSPHSQDSQGHANAQAQ